MARKKDELLTKARKSQILDAAAQCFVAFGIHQASMREICAKAELSAGAVYNYFPSKEAIVEALADRERREIQELSDYLNTSKNCFKAVIQAAKWIIEDTSVENARLQVEMLSEANRNQAVKARLNENDTTLSSCFTDTIKRGQEEKTIDTSLPAEDLVQLVTVTYEGFIGRLAAEGNTKRKKMAKLAQYSLEQLLKPK